MAKDANINIRIEKEVKSNAEALFASFGITVSDAIKIFLHQSLRLNWQWMKQDRSLQERRNQKTINQRQT